MLLSFGFVVVGAIAFQYFNVQGALEAALLWVQNLGTTGIIAFIILYNLATILFIPGALLTFSGGALYGVFWGSIYVIIASTLGAIIAFLIGRHFARGWVSKQLQGHPKFEAIDSVVAQNGLKIVFLTRLSPIFPFNLLNYAFGITCVSLSDYVLGSVGMFPGSVMYVYIGSLAGDLTSLGMAEAMDSQVQLLQWAIKIVGLLATIGVTIYVSRLARNALQRNTLQANTLQANTLQPTVETRVSVYDSVK